MGKRERRQQGREQERKEEESNCQFNECNQFSSIQFSSVQHQKKVFGEGGQFQSGFGEISTAIIILVPAFFFSPVPFFAFFFPSSFSLPTSIRQGSELVARDPQSTVEDDKNPQETSGLLVHGREMEQLNTYWRGGVRPNQRTEQTGDVQ